MLNHYIQYVAVLKDINGIFGEFIVNLKSFEHFLIKDELESLTNDFISYFFRVSYSVILFLLQ